MVAACSTVHRRAFSGPASASEDVALVKLRRSVNGPSAQLKLVDGVAINPQGWFVRWADEVEVLPGDHVLQIGYTDGNSHSVTDARLPFTAFAGGLYEVRAARL